MQSIEDNSTVQISSVVKSTLFNIFAKVLFSFPWLWLITLLTFILVITIQHGEFPTYGQPDPAQAGVVSDLFYSPTMLLLILTMISAVIAVPLAAYTFWSAFKQANLSSSALYYLVSLLSFCIVTFLTVAFFTALYDELVMWVDSNYTIPALFFLHSPPMALITLTVSSAIIGSPLAIHKFRPAFKQSHLAIWANLYFVAIFIFFITTLFDAAGIMVWLLD